MNTSSLLNESYDDTLSARNFPSVVETFKIVAPAALLIDRIITPIWYTIGIICNPIVAKIWLSQKMRKTNSSAIYLGSIAIVHFIFIFLHMLLELHLAWDVTTYNRPHFCEVFNFFYMTFQYLAPLLILGFTVERYIAVCHPFSKDKYCTVKRAFTTVIILTILSLLLGSVQSYIWSYMEVRKICALRKGSHRFYLIWTWLSEMLIFVVVPVLALIFNILVIREIRILTRRDSYRGRHFSSNYQNNQTSTVTLLCVSFYLICTLLPATLVYSVQSLIPDGNPSHPFEQWPTDPGWRPYLTYFTIRKIVEEICFSNCACYIFVYYLTGAYFKKEVQDMFKQFSCKFIRKKKVIHSKTQEYTLVTSNGRDESVTLSL
ncbi:hypothetical protein ACJMK2_044652 [Sinanodonta woodiana]|uniref:G-protein coupled receptors family 1 profile domain-containing protein n=1 Tax=Sinanodonta woodiana TaxID=1069815 RepID=A0ABD3W1L3_SINWO